MLCRLRVGRDCKYKPFWRASIYRCIYILFLACYVPVSPRTVITFRYILLVHPGLYLSDVKNGISQERLAA
jgi:hypothetical protein